MHSYLAPVRDLDDLTVEQRRFLGGVAARIPELIEAIQAGTMTARFKLGTGAWMTDGTWNWNWLRGYPNASGMGSPNPGVKCRWGRQRRRTRDRPISVRR